jgi:hypothetical protein
MNTAQTSPQTPSPTAFGTTLTEDRAATLLGTGIAPATVAASLGISAARVSQLLSDEHFAARVAELRYQNLAKHNARDDVTDALEDRVLAQLDEALPLIHRPMELVKAYQVLNNAKRRGSAAPEAIIEKQSIVQLVVPIQILNKFQMNAQGQATTVGGQDLLTIQSGALDNLVKEKEKSNGSPAVGHRVIESEDL